MLSETIKNAALDYAVKVVDMKEMQKRAKATGLQKDKEALITARIAMYNAEGLLDTLTQSTEVGAVESDAEFESRMMGD